MFHGSAVDAVGVHHDDGEPPARRVGQAFGHVQQALARRGRERARARRRRADGARERRVLGFHVHVLGRQVARLHHLAQAFHHHRLRRDGIGGQSPAGAPAARPRRTPRRRKGTASRSFGHLARLGSLLSFGHQGKGAEPARLHADAASLAEVVVHENRLSGCGGARRSRCGSL